MANSTSKAKKDLQQIPGTISPYYQPYIDAGNQALGTVGNEYSNLISGNQDLNDIYAQLLHPDNIIKMLGGSFEASPEYQWELSQGENAISNAQAAGGMAGSPQHQQYSADLAQKEAQKSFDDYMRMALGIGRAGLGGKSNLYQTGLKGEQGISQMGFNAANSLAQNLAQALMSQSNLEYSSGINKRQQNMGLLGNLIGGAAHVLPFYS